jgi:hypothetical protein
MANIVDRLDRFNFKAGLARHLKPLATLVLVPYIFVTYPHPALAADDLDNLWAIGRKFHRRGQDHPNGFASMIREAQVVRDNAPVEVNIRVLVDRYMFEM